METEESFKGDVPDIGVSSIAKQLHPIFEPSGIGETPNIRADTEPRESGAYHTRHTKRTLCFIQRQHDILLLFFRVDLWERTLKFNGYSQRNIFICNGRDLVGNLQIKCHTLSTGSKM